MAAVDGDTRMNLDVFREALLAEARSDAQRLLSEAESEADQRTGEARARAEELVEKARAEGSDIAERETARDRASARRSAREQILAAQREVYEELRQRATAAAENADGLGALEDRLEELARDQLGAGARIKHPTDGGGLLAVADDRRVDYRVPALVDRALTELGAELRGLWE